MKNKKNKHYILERTISQIVDSVDDNTALIPQARKYNYSIFELLYEIEYKYNMINNHDFKGLQQRKENILKILVDKGNIAIKAISEGMIDIFDYWIVYHTETNNKKWAEIRYNRFVEKYDNVSVINEDLVLSLQDFCSLSKFKQFVLNHFGKLPLFKKIVLNNDENNVKNLSRYSQISDVILEQDNEKQKLMYIELMSNVVYQQWRLKYGNQIDSTVKIMQEATKKLINLENETNIKKKFAILNEVINICHTSGSIMDYIDEYFNITAFDLFKFSKWNVKKWNEELQDIGVMMNNNVSEITHIKNMPLLNKKRGLFLKTKLYQKG